MFTPKNPHPLAKYVAGQVAKHQQAAQQQSTDALGDAWTDTAIDQIPYVGNAKNIGVAGKHLYNDQPFQAATNLIKAHPAAKVYIDAALNHLEPLAADWDDQIGTPVSKTIRKSATKAFTDAPTAAQKRQALKAYSSDMPARRAEGLQSLNTFREKSTALAQDAYRAAQKATGFKTGGQWSFAEGGELDQFPDGGQYGKKKAKAKPAAPAWGESNLNDFEYTDGEVNFMNTNSKDFCFKGDCLQVGWQAYDSRVGGKYPEAVFPSSNKIKEALGVQSATPQQYAKMSEANKNKLRNLPYMNPDDPVSPDLTMDSWDVHGQIVEKGGKNIYKDTDNSRAYYKMTPEERMKLYEQIPIGAVVGMGLRTKEELGKLKSVNNKYGLPASRHSAVVVGYAPDGMPIMYDYERYYRMDSQHFHEDFYPINNISYPKELEGRNRAWLKEQNLLNPQTTPLNLKYDKLGGDKEQLGKFTGALSEHKQELMNSLNMSSDEYDKIAKMVTGISMQETRGGKSVEHKLQGWLVDKFDGFDPMGTSHGMTQLTIGNLTDDPELAGVAARYGITSKRDLYDPAKAAIASMIYGTRNKSMSRNFNEQGQDEGVRTFKRPDKQDPRQYGKYIPLLGMDTISSFENDGFLAEESDERIPLLDYRLPFTQDVGIPRDLKDIQADLDKLNKGRYTVRTNADGRIEIDKKTYGNQVDDDGAFLYSWQTPNAVKTGDAQGKSLYFKRIKEFMTKMD